MKKVSYTEISYHEFQKLVEEHYGVHKYSFVATEECGNDSQHTFSVPEKEPLDKYDTEELKKFVADDGVATFVNHTLFQDLVNKGLLEPGEYLVEVCW